MSTELLADNSSEIPKPPVVATPTSPAAVQNTELAFAEAMGLREMDIVIFKRAQFWSGATVIPKDYQGKVANCFIACQLAHRLSLDPLFVMNNLYVVHGRPAWGSQGLIQLVKLTKVLKDLTYEIDKTDKDNWKCVAVGETQDGRIVRGPEISIKTAKDMGWWEKNPIWRNATELMLRYRSASWLIRTEFPECTGGIQTKDELDDVGPEPQQRPHSEKKFLDDSVN